MLTIVWANDIEVTSLARVKAVSSTKAAAKAVMKRRRDGVCLGAVLDRHGPQHQFRLMNATTRAMAKQPKTRTQTD